MSQKLLQTMQKQVNPIIISVFYQFTIAIGP